MNALLMSDVGKGLFVFLLGLLVVFFGMVIIVAVISVIGKIMKASDNKKALKLSAPSPVDVEKKNEDDDGRICAAVIAAISAYYFSENKRCEYKVKRIKRI